MADIGDAGARALVEGVAQAAELPRQAFRQMCAIDLDLHDGAADRMAEHGVLLHRGDVERVRAAVRHIEHERLGVVRFAERATSVT